ncbi:MAG: hypothetical protein WBA31_05805 [Candidatus Dormiibacterota bacterium]
MAAIRIDGDDLLLVLSGLEKVEAAHGDLRVPLSSVGEVEVVDRPLDYLAGLKLIGMGLPGSAVGTWVSEDGEIFAVEHHASRGLVIRLQGQHYREMIVGSADPEALAEEIKKALPR